MKPAATPEVPRCEDKHPSGSTCGLLKGHTGDHNALGWALSGQSLEGASQNQAPVWAAPPAAPPVAGVTDGLREEVERLRAARDASNRSVELLSDEVDYLRRQKDGAYQERDRLVAVLARVAQAMGLPVWRGYHEGENWDADWRNIIFVELPTGQVSWHIHDSELPMFDVAQSGAGPVWDGHTTPQKYERLLSWRPSTDSLRAARLEEREAVVRWLQEKQRTWTSRASVIGSVAMERALAMKWTIEEIERGDHASPPGKTGPR